MKLFHPAIGLAFMLSLFTTTTLATTTKYSPQGIAYMSGGIGDEEVAALKRHQQAFNLHLLFSKGVAGEAVTNVNVSIYDTEGQLVFRLHESLPRLNIQLPPQRYAIVANLLGEKQSHRLALEAGETKRVILNWKDKPTESEAESIVN